MSNINESLAKIMSLDGAKAVSLVDYESGMLLGEDGSGVDMELAAAGNSEVVKSKIKTMKNLGLKAEIEDILITISTQYHIIRPIASQKGLFFYVVLDKEKSNLALSRRLVLNVEKELSV